MMVKFNKECQQILGLFPQPSPHSCLLWQPVPTVWWHQLLLQVSLALKARAGWFSYFIFEEPFKLEVTSSLSFSRTWSILSGGVFVTDIRHTEEHFQLYWTHWQYLHDRCYLNRKIPWYLLSSEGNNCREGIIFTLIDSSVPASHPKVLVLLPPCCLDINHHQHPEVSRRRH